MEPTLEEVAGVQTNDVLPQLEELRKLADHNQGQINELFAHLSSLMQDLDKLKKAGES